MQSRGNGVPDWGSKSQEGAVVCCAPPTKLDQTIALTEGNSSRTALLLVSSAPLSSPGQIFRAGLAATSISPTAYGVIESRPKILSLKNGDCYFGSPTSPAIRSVESFPSAFDMSAVSGHIPSSYACPQGGQVPGSLAMEALMNG